MLTRVSYNGFVTCQLSMNRQVVHLLGTYHLAAVNTLGSFMHAVISGSLTVAAYSMHPKLLLEFWQPEFYGSSKLCPIVALSAAVTLGYLVIDTWHTVYHGYAPVKVPILVHHICMSTGVSLMLYYDVAMPYLAMGLACELQSSFMHLWWLMSTHRWHLGHFLPKVIWLTIAITYIFTRYAAHGVMAYCGLFLSQTWKPVLASHGAPEALGWMAGVAFSGFTYLNLVLHLDLWGRFKRDSKEATFLMKVEAAVDEEAREALWQDKWREMRERKEQKKQARARAKAGKGGSKK